MPETPVLAITEVAAAQDQKEVTINEAIRALENATQITTTIDIDTDTTYTLTQAELSGSYKIVISGTPASAVTLTLAGTPRSFYIENACGQTITIEEDAGDDGPDGTTVDVENSSTSLIYTDGTDVEVPASSGGGSGTDIDVSQNDVTVVAGISKINFTGTFVTVTDDGEGGVDVAISGSSSSVSGGGFPSGWADFSDSTYTSGSPFSLSADTDTDLPNDGVNGVKTYQPAGLNLYDTSNELITGIEGHGRLITINMKVTPTDPSTTNLEVWIDIGGSVGELYRRIVTFPKGNGVEREITLTTAVYTLDTWEANGGTVRVRANGTANIYDIRYVIHHIHPISNNIIQTDMSYVRVEQTSGQSLTSSTTSTIEFQNVVSDADGIFDEVNEHMVIPEKLNGKTVVMNFQMQHSADASGTLEAYIERSTDSGSSWDRVGQSSVAGIDNFGIADVTFLGQVSTGDLFRVRVFTGTSKTTRGDSRVSWTMQSFGAISISNAALLAVNDQVGSTYTSVLSDANNLVLMNNAGANTFTIPLNSSVAYAVGTMITVKQTGTGSTTVGVTPGATLNGVSGGEADIDGRWGTVTFTKIGTDAWTLDGAHGSIT